VFADDSASMPVDEDRNTFSSLGAGPEVQRPGAAVGYQLIDVNKTTSGARSKSPSHRAVGGVNRAPTKPPKSVVSTTSLSTSPQRHTHHGRVNISTSANTTTSQSTARLETILASKADSVSGDAVTSTYYYDHEVSTTNEAPGTSSSVSANSTVDSGTRTNSHRPTASGESRLRGKSDVVANASSVTVSASRDQYVGQPASTTWLPEVDGATGGEVEKRNATGLAGGERTRSLDVRYVHTLLTGASEVSGSDGDGVMTGGVAGRGGSSSTATMMTLMRAPSLIGAGLGALYFVAIVVVVVVVACRRRRRTCGRRAATHRQTDRS